MKAIEDQVIIVTGATDGLGKLVARNLAVQQATVLLHGRNRQKGQAVLQKLRERTGNRKLLYYNADLSSLDSVRQLADQILADQTHLDLIINNAGIGPGLGAAPREKSRDDYELRFAVNYLAPFLLTHRLLPLLGRRNSGRIVNVASAGQHPIDFDNVMLANDYDGLRAYMQSKLAQVMFTFDLAEKLEDRNITVNCLHPATLMNTKMVYQTDYFNGAMSTVEQGAAAVEYLAVSPDLNGVTGQYFDGNHRAQAAGQAYDKKARRQLWELSEKFANIKIYAA